MGWIKIHRQLFDWEWYKDSNMVHLFIHLLLSANHADGNWQGILLKRGQFITGRKKLSEQTGIAEQSLRTCLNRLKSTREITIKSTNKFSIITICKYDSYQDTEIKTNQQINQQTNQQLTSNQPATNQQLTTNKKNKNDNNDNNKNNESVFTPPSKDDVFNFMLVLFNRNEAIVFAEKFYYHYDARNWAHIKNWKSQAKKAALTWDLPPNTKRTIGTNGKIVQSNWVQDDFSNESSARNHATSEPESRSLQPRTRY